MEYARVVLLLVRHMHLTHFLCDQVVINPLSPNSEENKMSL